MLTASFGEPHGDQSWYVNLAEPAQILTAMQVDQVVPLLHSAEAAARSGSYVALLICYEAAPAFDPVFATHAPGPLPLAWAAVFPETLPPLEVPASTYSTNAWTPEINRGEYMSAVARIRELIAAGDTYQVNYSFPLASSFEGNAFSWYRDLSLAQGAKFSAYLNLGRYQVLSLSPELFFKRSGCKIVTRPMKGTVRRGRWLAEDEQLTSWLLNSAKDRAENVMIVDLLRNDLGKVSEPGSVRVSKLFDLERFETVWQLTSTVESTLRDETTLADLMTALFPCGSITGAPKIRTMEIIRELERFPRGPYTGAIGFLRPGGDCIFNVAIRTVLLDSDTGLATFGVGGGITIGSTAEREYEECVVKSQFLLHRPANFDLFESLLLEDANYFLLDRHLNRLKSSARYFGFNFSEAEIVAALNINASAHPTGSWKTRLLLSKAGFVRTETSEIKPADDKWKVAIATEPIDSANRFLFHKTTNREFYSQQVQARPDCDDIVFWNERGEVTETSIANIVIGIEGELYTPHVEAGLLAGTFRNQLLAEQKIFERTITVEDLRKTRELFLINSVRTWIRAEVVE